MQKLLTQPHYSEKSVTISDFEPIRCYSNLNQSLRTITMTIPARARRVWIHSSARQANTRRNRFVEGHSVLF